MEITFINLKIAWRNLRRNKAFTFINAAGLTLGTAVFLLIMEYVAFQWSANRFHKNFDQLYRLSIFENKSKIGDYYLPPGLAPIINNNFETNAQAVRIADGIGSGVISIPGKGKNSSNETTFRENDMSFVDGNFFKVFSFPIVTGDGSLDRPQTMAISQTEAQKYFGTVNVTGKILSVSNQFGTIDYTITTVFKDITDESDIKGDIFLSLKTLENKAFQNGNDWADPNGTGSGFSNIYLLLNKNTDEGSFAAQITSFLKKTVPNFKDEKIGLQPMSTLRLAPDFNYPYQSSGSIVLVFSFFIIAILILAIAWVNYINLSTAQALNRAKEVGIRKILGAAKANIIGQQLTETLLLMIISIFSALFIVKLFQPVYNNFTGHFLSLAVLNNGLFWFISLTLIVTGTFLAGIYVSFILSSFNPLKTIRSKASVTIGGVSLRKSLVVFQFVVSVFFIIGTIVLYRQLHFMQKQDLGFKPDQLIAITGPALQKSSNKQASQAFENELSNLPFITKYAASNNIPGNGYNFSTQGITRLSPTPGDEKKSFSMLIVDDKYFSTYGMSMKEGSTFTPLMINQGWSKIKKVILNEAAVNQLGFKKDLEVVGQKIKWGDDYEVVGVVKNYHHMSLHTLIEPMIFLPAIAKGYFTVKMDPQNLEQKISKIHQLFQNSFPGEPFSYSFVDQLFDQQYRDEQKMGQMFVSSAGVAIFIACLGLFGLATFAAKQRTKEIGIRKVLGATVANITGMLSFDFIKLVAVAICFASPVSWYLMNKWLQSFAYRIDIQWWMFFCAGLIITSIALITIGFQSIKAALNNPVNSLRSE